MTGTIWIADEDGGVPERFADPRKAAFVGRGMAPSVDPSELAVLRSVGRALPRNYCRQEVLTEALAQEWELTGDTRARCSFTKRST